jgi:hypothetical protein
VQAWLPASQLVSVERAQVSLVADARAVVTVVQDAEPGRISPDARQIWLAAVLVEPAWLVVQETWLEVARAEPVSAPVVPLAFRQALLGQGQQLVPVDYDSAERSRQLVAAPEQSERESLGRLVFRQQSA